MKVVIFMEDYYLGGVDTLVINLINSWPDTNDDIFLICNSKHTGLQYLKKSISRSRTTIINHSMPIFTAFFELKKPKFSDQWFILFMRLLSPILRYLFIIYDIFALRTILTQLAADRLIIVNGGYPGGDSCRAASICWGFFSRKPLAIHSVNGIALKPGWHIALQEFIVDSVVSCYTKNFVTVSNAVAETFLCRRGIKQSKVRTIYNGVSFRKYAVAPDAKESLKKELGIADTSRLCLMMGGYHINKNFDKGYEFAVRIFKSVLTSVPEAHLVICGYGSDEDIARVRGLTFKCGVESHVHLYRFRTDIRRFLQAADLVLIASQKFESFCFVSIEAWAHKVPVVATSVGGIPEVIIDNYGGYCIDYRDTDGYISHIVRLLSDEALRVNQGRLGYERFQAVFSASRMSGEYASLIHGG